MRDDETQSYRVEQGKPGQPDPREHMGSVPIVFSSEGGGAGVVLPGTDERLGPPPGETAAAADATRAVERGAAAIEAERHAASGAAAPSPPQAGVVDDARTDDARTDDARTDGAPRDGG